MTFQECYLLAIYIMVVLHLYRHHDIYQFENRKDDIECV